MSRITLDISKINPEDLNYLKKIFNEKTYSKTICKAIEYLVSEMKTDKEKIREALTKYMKKANEYEKLKSYIQRKNKIENKINNLVNNYYGK